ncbi:MAG: ribonuclease P protein component [Candidatus Firestonebacteria bacterium]
MYNSLTREAFGEVFEKGKKKHFKDLTLIVLKDGGARFRFGVCFKRKAPPNVRNKAKRRIRSILSPLVSRMEHGLNLVISITPDAASTEFVTLKDSLLKALKETGLM